MPFTPIALASLIHLAGAPSTCAQFLTCGTYSGEATQIHPDQTGKEVIERVEDLFDFSDAGPGVVRLIQRTKNLDANTERTSTWEFTRRENGKFTIREVGETSEDARHGRGSCRRRQCTFVILPKEALAAGTFDFSRHGFSYWISEMDPTTKKLSSRFVFTRRAPTKR